MRNALAGCALLIFTVGGQTSLVAAETASECKGLEQNACSGNQRCSWVKQYKTTKGRDVAAFCRKKPERKNSAEAKPAPSSTQ
jgi:hypothetical protein